MVICRKVGSQEPIAEAGKNGRNGRRHTSGFEGGPVFLPPRPPSPFAQALLAKSVEGDDVTSYDELWFLGRPRAS